MTKIILFVNVRLLQMHQNASSCIYALLAIYYPCGYDKDAHGVVFLMCTTC